jgi:hypothetical protein
LTARWKIAWTVKLLSVQIRFITVPNHSMKKLNSWVTITFVNSECRSDLLSGIATKLLIDGSI